MAKAKKNTISVIARVAVEVGFDVEANTLEQALELASAYKVTDLVTIHGEHQESTVRIVSVWQPSSLD